MVALVVVLLRGGLVALMVAHAITHIATYAMTNDWSAWYAQLAVTCLVIVVILAFYGFWAAVASRARRGQAG